MAETAIYMKKEGKKNEKDKFIWEAYQRLGNWTVVATAYDIVITCSLSLPSIFFTRTSSIANVCEEILPERVSLKFT